MILRVLKFSFISTVLFAAAPTADAQPAGAKPALGDDLRAIYANAADIAEGRRLADTACARCHSATGISSRPGIPNIAGQRAAYVHLQLRAYREGTRAKGPMGSAVNFLSDDALVKVAAYYGSLEPARPVAGAHKPGARQPDPVQSGKAAAAGCAGCHGEGGVSKTQGTPSLVGLDPKYFVAAMTAYKSGERKHDLMKSMAGTLSEADTNNVALYYALGKPTRAQTAAAGDQAAGKAASAACAGCHGETGVSENPPTPSLAGQDAQYLAAAMLAYKDSSRKDETMKGIAAGLDDKTIKNVAAYYAAQQPRAPKVHRPLTTGEWIDRCDRCHGTNGNSTGALIPALAGQRADWLEAVLQAYRSGARKSSAMSAMSSALSDADVKELSAYYARQAPRAVVYVVIPEGNR